jgi:hypothetical protein
MYFSLKTVHHRERQKQGLGMVNLVSAISAMASLHVVEGFLCASVSLW